MSNGVTFMSFRSTARSSMLVVPIITFARISVGAMLRICGNLRRQGRFPARN
jgi:hypothetical protein